MLRLHLAPRLYAIRYTLLLLLAACTPIGVVVGAGATAGSAAISEQGMDGAATDLWLRGRILAALAETPGAFSRVDVAVYNRAVLLTGDVAGAEKRLEVVRRIWQISGDIRTIYNEIEIRADAADLGEQMRDAQIAASIRAAWTLDKNIWAVNYTLAVHRRVVYVMGTARDATERARVLAAAKNTDYVLRVADLIEKNGNKK
jgi:osmotically-inducible protein OsmY